MSLILSQLVESFFGCIRLSQPRTIQTRGQDLEAGAVSVCLHHGGPQGAKRKGEVVADILASIRERRAQLRVADRLSAIRQITNLRYGGDVARAERL
jgi:hypothetical protein